MSDPKVKLAKYATMAGLACRLSVRQRLLAEGHALDPLRPIDEVGQAVGYKPKHAAAVFGLPKVQAYVEALLQGTRGEERLDKHFSPVLMGVNEALGRLALIARSEIGDHVKRDDRGRIFTDIDLENSYGIKELTVTETVDLKGDVEVETRFKMEDKKPALELILKAHGVFQEDAEKGRRKDVAREAIWREHLIKHPELAKELHLKLLALEADQAPGMDDRVIELERLPVPKNGHGAAAA